MCVCLYVYGYLCLPASFLHTHTHISSGYTISYESFYLGRTYSRNLLFIAALQALALMINQWSIINSDGHHEYIFACAVAMGCQNALSSKYR